jgi:hypothetical protein
MSTDLEKFADIISLMELCAQLEEELAKIFSALPKLKENLEAGAREKYETLTKRSAAIEGRLGEIATQFETQDRGVKAEFARLEKAIQAGGRVLADYNKKLENEIPKPVEEKIKALFAVNRPKDGNPGKAGKDGKDASLLTGFRGNWKEEVQYNAGEWFTFRGSSYLVLRDCRGQIPTKITQTGDSAFYAVFAMSGAPGLPGVGTGAGVGDVIGPASATDNALARFDLTTGKLIQNSVLIVADTTGALSGFTTGAGITFHEGGTLTGASGALSLTASGTNQNVTITPSGTGVVTTSKNMTFTSGTALISTGTTDGADNGYIQIAGGGAVDTARGAGVTFVGNEFATASSQGVIEFLAGTDSSGNASAGSHRWSTAGATRMFLWKSGGLQVATSPAADPGAANVLIGAATSATYNRLVVGGGISTLPDTSSKLQLGRFSAGAPSSYIKLGTSATALRITNAADTADILSLADSSGAAGLTGGAGNMTITAGTGASRTLTLRTTTAGSTATDALVLSAAQNATFGGSVTTSTPNGGTAGAWKFGIRVEAVSALDTTQYIELDVGGTLYKLALIA